MKEETKIQKDNWNLRKDITLLMIGALISATTAFISDYMHEKRDSKKRNIEKKLELNDQLSKDLSKRAFLTIQGYKSKRDHDSIGYKKIANDYLVCKEEWNLKRYSYVSLLRNYYGDSVQLRYKSIIYDPLIALGQQVEYDKIDSDFVEKYFLFERNADHFISDIYKKVED